MTRTSLSLALMALLAACGDGQPLFDEEVEDTTTELEGIPFEDIEADDVDEPEDVLNAGTVAPPLRDTLQDRGDIVRTEARNDLGGGASSLFSYDGDNDTFVIDGLAFDGLNTYQRFAALPQLGNVAVYRGDAVVEDLISTNDISQIVPYFALYDVSETTLDDGTPRTTFAVVRTGGYRDFGFGTFAYQRAGSFAAPTEGQATFSGTYAGARVLDTFSSGSTDEFEAFALTQADVTIDIDFDDFNGTPGIKGILTNRQAFDEDGATVEVNNSIFTANGSTFAIQLPDLPFDIRSTGTTISTNGEIGGTLSNTIINREGSILEYETGSYLGILAGDLTDPNDGGEIVGVIVIQSEDSRFNGVLAQETGGFIATR